ncbi:hypothetical protein CAEBREN_12869 [Caenorhabditis brenneri]|uniref:DUF38 domain-containing protein n=1 Tax=Caenorhabditis brenneri TaxID=135651 RepID=G0NDC6_CAEBE|nr:hypothetical protein CAEBREN_12869 [Caenorhabditis brenneri]
MLARHSSNYALCRLYLRKVSRNLRSIVDRETTNCESVVIEFSRNRTWLSVDSPSIVYECPEEGLCIAKHVWESNKPSKVKLNGSHWELAVKDLSSFLTNRNWKFGEIDIRFDPEDTFEEKKEDDANRLNALVSILSSPMSPSKIYAEKIHIASETLAPVITLLPYFQPKTLKSLSFWCDRIHKKHLKQLMKTENWKTADELVLLKSKTLECCLLGTTSITNVLMLGDSDLEALNEKVVGIMEEDPAYTRGRYNIEGANFYFEIKCERNGETVRLEVRKKPISG